MNRKAREIETIALTMLAAAPLYVTGAISPIPLAIFHAAMLATAIRVAMGKGPEVVPASVMRFLAIGYIAFYVIDAAVLSHSAIAASTHLVLFIAAYQPIESLRTNNRAQRLLTTALIFVASIATATHISIVLYVLLFGYLMLRQLMYVSHAESVRAIGREVDEPASGGAAAFYLLGATLVGVLLFPVIPRIRNPFVQGVAGSLTNASTGLSDSIDFNQPRSSSSDPAVVARVWMPKDAIPFFTPLRLRGAIYERFWHNEWKQGPRDFFPIPALKNGNFRIASPRGLSRTATVQQHLVLGSRLLLPVGTFRVLGVPQLYEGPTRGVYMTWMPRRDAITYEVGMAAATAPLRPTIAHPTNYPYSPAVLALARTIVPPNTDKPLEQAALVEHYLSSRFTYVADAATIGHAMTVDQFLLKERRGHCEYFAAGMVALMTSLGTPARIVGGFYGGKLNPLTGYFVVRREDAHAWVEVWSGDRWETFDPTPVSLRPGNLQSGLFGAYASALGDSVNYFWDRYILTYGLGDQIALASDLIGRLHDLFGGARHIGFRNVRSIASRQFQTTVAVLLALSAAIVLLARRRRTIFDLLARHLQRLGIEVGPATTMAEALEQLRGHDPEAASRLAPLIELYEAERFSSHVEPRRRAMLKKRLAELAS